MRNVQQGCMENKYKYIKKCIISALSPMLIHELQNNKKIDSIYIYTVSNFCNLYIFCDELEPEYENKLKEEIYEYVYALIKHKIDFENILPIALIKKVREYIGYNRQLLYFDFDYLPKNLIKEIDEYTNSIFPSFDIRYYSSNLKFILPPNALEIRKK